MNVKERREIRSQMAWKPASQTVTLRRALEENVLGSSGEESPEENPGIETGMHLPDCPACSGNQFQKLFMKKGRHFWNCMSCGLQMQYPLPTAMELAAYYDGSYKEGMYRAFADAGGMKAATARWRLEAVKSRAASGHW